MFRTHQKRSQLDRIIIDFDMKYLGNNDIQASILNIPVGIKYENNISSPMDYQFTIFLVEM